MKTKLLGSAVALGLAAAPLASFADVNTGNSASTWTIYGWQNYSYEFVDNDERDFSRINGNAANIGFTASIDTGLSLGGQALKADFRCEQFTFHNRFSGSGLCNRNSKIGLSGAFGDIHFGQWLLPHNEAVAQWIDPFYDASAESHSAIFGSVGFGTLFFNGGFGFSGAAQQGFNRRQDEIIQYFSPNINGVTFRLATTNANTDAEEQATGFGDNAPGDLDPRIWSTSLAYETTTAAGHNIWVAATYETHDEWAAVSFACDDSDDDSWRLAGRYIHQWGNGLSTRISVAYEDLEYDWDDCANGTLLTTSTTGPDQAPAGGGDVTPGAVSLASVGGLGADLNNLELERSAWLVSGIQTFGNGLDFRFTYVDADEFDCDTCANDDDTDASFYSVGLFYTMPAGTELRLTYSEVDNEDNAQYDFGINGSGVAQGDDVDLISIGIVQWF